MSGPTKVTLPSKKVKDAVAKQERPYVSDEHAMKLE